MITSFPFETERQVVRGVQSKDFDRFHALLTLKEVVEMVPHPPFSMEYVKQRFNENIANGYSNWRSENSVAFAVLLKEEEEIAGLFLYMPRSNGRVEVGYRYLPEYWGIGLATEVMQGALDFLSGFADIHELLADAWIENGASCKVLSKFMKPTRVFWNTDFSCWDQHYSIKNSSSF